MFTSGLSSRNVCISCHFQSSFGDDSIANYPEFFSCEVNALTTIISEEGVGKNNKKALVYSQIYTKGFAFYDILEIVKCALEQKYGILSVRHLLNECSVVFRILFMRLCFFLADSIRHFVFTDGSEEYCRKDLFKFEEIVNFSFFRAQAFEL